MIGTYFFILVILIAAIAIACGMGVFNYERSVKDYKTREVKTVEELNGNLVVFIFTCAVFWPFAAMLATVVIPVLACFFLGKFIRKKMNK